MKTTTLSNHELQDGDMLSYTKPETRWLIRLWKFITYQDYTTRQTLESIRTIDFDTVTF